MYFTQEDFKRIENWLKLHAIKDTLLPKLPEGSNNIKADSDITTIVHNGVNYKIKLSDFINEGLKLTIVDKITAKDVEADTLDVDNVTINEDLEVKGNTTIEGNTEIKGLLDVLGDIHSGGDIFDSDNNSLSETTDIAKRGWKIEKESNPQDEPTVKDRYKLLNFNNVQFGETIKVYKDSAIKSVFIGHINTRVNSTTGQIKPTEPDNLDTTTDDALCIVYHLEDGTYEIVNIPLDSFFKEAKFDKKRGIGLDASTSKFYIKLARDTDTKNFAHFNDSGELTVDGILEVLDELEASELTREQLEEAREDNEAIRQSNEVIRENNETDRITNEDERVANEELRQINTTKAISATNAATNAANAAALLANEAIRYAESINATAEGDRVLVIDRHGVKHYTDHLTGPQGPIGHTPIINSANGSDINTVGTPSVTSTTSADGLTTTFTFHKLKGTTGATGSQGPHGVSPTISPTTHNWMVYDEDLKKKVDSGVLAEANVNLTFDDLSPALLESLKGDSAYLIWLDAGNIGSKNDFLESLKGTEIQVVNPVKGINSTEVLFDDRKPFIIDSTLSEDSGVTVHWVIDTIINLTWFCVLDILTPLLHTMKKFYVYHKGLPFCKFMLNNEGDLVGLMYLDNANNAQYSINNSYQYSTATNVSDYCTFINTLYYYVIPVLHEKSLIQLNMLENVTLPTIKDEIKNLKKSDLVVTRKLSTFKGLKFKYSLDRINWGTVEDDNHLILISSHSRIDIIVSPISGYFISEDDVVLKSVRGDNSFEVIKYTLTDTGEIWIVARFNKDTYFYVSNVDGSINSHLANITVSDKSTYAPTVFLMGPATNESGSNVVIKAVIVGFYPKELIVNWKINDQVTVNGIVTSKPYHFIKNDEKTNYDLYIVYSTLTISRDLWQGLDSVSVQVTHLGKMIQENISFANTDSLGFSTKIDEGCYVQLINMNTDKLLFINGSSTGYTYNDLDLGNLQQYLKLDTPDTLKPADIDSKVHEDSSLINRQIDHLINGQIDPLKELLGTLDLDVTYTAEFICENLVLTIGSIQNAESYTLGLYYITLENGTKAFYPAVRLIGLPLKIYPNWGKDVNGKDKNYYLNPSIAFTHTDEDGVKTLYRFNGSFFTPSKEDYSKTLSNIKHLLDILKYNLNKSYEIEFINLPDVVSIPSTTADGQPMSMEITALISPSMGVSFSTKEQAVLECSTEPYTDISYDYDTVTGIIRATMVNIKKGTYFLSWVGNGDFANYKSKTIKLIVT